MLVGPPGSVQHQSTQFAIAVLGKFRVLDPLVIIHDLTHIGVGRIPKCGARVAVCEASDRVCGPLQGDMKRRSKPGVRRRLEPAFVFAPYARATAWRILSGVKAATQQPWTFALLDFGPRRGSGIEKHCLTRD
jgi:hypothetical protein